MEKNPKSKHRSPQATSNDSFTAFFLLIGAGVGIC